MWRWCDAVTHETGCCRFRERGLEPGDEVVAELRRAGVGWELVRVVQRRERAFVPIDPADLAGVGDVAEDAPAVQYGPRVPRRGELRITRHRMDGRSMSDLDAGKSSKDRPVVVVWVDEHREQCGVRFVAAVGAGQTSKTHQQISLRSRGW